MDQQTTPPITLQKKSSSVLPIIGIIIVALAALAYATTRKPEMDNQMQATQETGTMLADSTATYADGTYTATGNYTSPGGAESIVVTLTLENDIVVAAEVQKMATLPTSVLMQTDFANNFKQYVIGKNIADLELTKVSGSSLTPKGFNDAVAKIKFQATAQS